MRNVFLSYQIFDFIAIFCPFTPTPQKIVAQKPKTISSKSDKIQAISVFSLFFSVPILYNNT